MTTSATEIAQLEAWARKQIPMIEFVDLKINELDAQHCMVTIPFKPQNCNHLKSMYFGVLAVGADVASGCFAMHLIKQAGEALSIQFKDFKADFLKRAYGDICFTCDDAEVIQKAIHEVIAEKKRVNTTVKVIATEKENPSEVMAEFLMTLSIK